MQAYYNQQQQLVLMYLHTKQTNNTNKTTIRFQSISFYKFNDSTNQSVMFNGKIKLIDLIHFFIVICCNLENYGCCNWN